MLAIFVEDNFCDVVSSLWLDPIGAQPRHYTGFQPRSGELIVAYGETVGSSSNNLHAPGGAAENAARETLSPLTGLVAFHRLTHGFTVGYFLSRFNR